MAKDCDGEAVKDYKVVGGGGQVKSMLKSGSLVPCSWSRVYKNPSSFSYKRMLPFLMDLAKDDTNAPQINPCRKVDKSSGEMTPASLSTAQEIHAITPEKETLSDEHPVDDSPTSPFNVECSNMESPEHHVLEPTTPKSPQTSVPCKASNFVIRDLPRLFSELASQALKDPSDRVSNFNGAPYFVHDKFSPTKSSLSVVIPESSLIKEDNELDKGRLKTNGNTEGGRCEGKQIPTAPPDGAAFCKVGPGTNKDCAPKSHLNNKSDREMSRCVGEDEKDRHPNSVEIGSYEAGLIQSTPQDSDASCKIGPRTGKDCALDSHLNNKSDHEMSRCTDENEKDSQPSSLEIENYEAELIQSTPPDGDAFCKLGPGMGKDCAPESQLSNKSDYEKNRCMGGDEKDRHPDSKAKLRRGAGSASDKPLDAKTLRRLAQNREAARKSRLRKKAYVQQLETSRLKLSQIEQDLQRARSQGLYLAGGASANLSSDAAIFDMEYSRWLEDDQRHMSEIRTVLQAHLSDTDLRMITDGYLAHYDEIFRLNGVTAKSDVFHLITGMWITPAERCFLWMGGFRPSELIKV